MFINKNQCSLVLPFVEAEKGKNDCTLHFKYNYLIKRSKIQGKFLLILIIHGHWTGHIEEIIHLDLNIQCNSKNKL